MFLRRVQIENIRSLEQFEMSCTEEGGAARRWTLLLGENGCGKSTVLRSIALAMMGSEALAQIIGDPGGWVRFGAKDARIDLELETADGSARTATLVLRKGMGVHDMLTVNAKSLRDLDAALRHADRSYLTLGYGASRRLNTDPDSAFSRVSSAKDPRARGVLTLFSQEATLDPFEAWVIGQEFQRRGSGVKLVREIDEHLLPGVEFKSIDKRSRQLIFKTPDGPIPLCRLSDGYQNIAAWTGDLLRTITTIFQDYKNPLTARALLLIDEIDLHLHPVWQRRLRGFLEQMFPNMQFVATTHSPLTAHQSGPGELHVMRRQSPKSPPTVDRFDGEPRRMMLHQLLASPIFGLETLDSSEVEHKRDQYRMLRAKPTLTSAEKKKKQKVASELKQLPRIGEAWSGELEPHRKAMQEILQIIKSKGSGTQKRASPRKKATSRKPVRRASRAGGRA